MRYPSGEIDRTLQKGSDNSAVTVIYSGVHPYSVDAALKLEALAEVLRLRVVDRIREELGTSYSPGVVSQFSKVPVGEYDLRFWVACSPDEAATVGRTIDGIIQALQANGPTAAELAKVTRTWLNEHDARTEDEPGPGQVGSAPRSGSGPGRGLGPRRPREGVDRGRRAGRRPGVRRRATACGSC